MRPLFVIFSCWRDDRQGKNEAVRQTYLKRWPGLVDHVFVMGRDPDSKWAADTMFVDVDDSYGWLPTKQRAAYFKLQHSPYDHFFICYTDTYVVIPKLLACGYEKEDYMGIEYEGRAAGGFGYWLSKDALTYLASRTTEPHTYSDKLDGDQLAYQKFKFTGMEPGATKHLSKDTNFYEAQWMYEAHNDAAL